MGIKKGFSHRGENPTNQVEKYIGTSYDVVKEVYNNLDKISTVASFSDDFSDTIDSNKLRIDQLEITTQENLTKINNIESNINTIENQVTSIDSSILTLNTDLSDLTLIVNNNALNVSTLSSSIISIENNVSINESDINNVETNLSTLTSSVDSLENQVNTNETTTTNINTRLLMTESLIQDFLDISETYAALGNTLSNNTGVPNPSGAITLNMTGTLDEYNTPPVSPQPVVNPDLNGYVRMPLSIIVASGLLSDSGDGGMLVNSGGDGFYTTPQAWLDMSSTASNNTVGFIFGIERGDNLYFSQRVTGSEMASGDDRTNVSGGGFVDLVEGDKIYVYGTSEKDCILTIFDANLGLTMRSK